MKRIALFFAVLGLAATLRAQDETPGYSVFRICQDQRVIHTSDGADVGHVEYILVDPTQQRIVSTVITGGAIGDRYVAVPYEDVQFQGDNIVLNNIDRERIVSAPAIEVNQLTSSRQVDTSFVQPSVSYFGTSTERRTTGAETSTSVNQEQTGPGTNVEVGRAGAESSAQRTEQNQPAAESSAQRAEQNQPPPSPSEAGTPSQARNPEARNTPQSTPGEPRNSASARHHHRQLNAEGGASGTPSANETPSSSASGRHASSAEQGTPTPEGQTGSSTRHHHHTSAADENSGSPSARPERTPGTSSGENSSNEASPGNRHSASTPGEEGGSSSHRHSSTSPGSTSSGSTSAGESRRSGSSSSAPESSSSSEHSAQGSNTP